MSQADAPKQLLDPDGQAAYLRLVDDPPEYRGEPGTIPIWFVVLCLLIPYIPATWYWFRELTQGLDDPLKWLGLGIWFVAGPGLLIAIYFLNRKLKSRGPFFILDTVRGTLTLPRWAVVLSKSRIVQFVQLSGWHKIHAESYFLYELCVLAESGDGAYEHYSVAVDNRRRTIARAGLALAEFYAVPLQAVKI